MSVLRQRSEGQAGLPIEREGDRVLGHQATLTRVRTSGAAASLEPVGPQKFQEAWRHCLPPIAHLESRTT